MKRRGIYRVNVGGSWRHGAAQSWRRMRLDVRAQGGCVWRRGGVLARLMRQYLF